MASTDTDLVEVPKYAHVYVDQVIGEYEAVRNAIPNLPVNELAQQIIDKYRSGTSLTWGEMYALEWLLVNFQSDEKRRALVPFLKARLAVLSGTGGQHLPAFDLAKSDSASVLAYVESLLREINRLLAVTACRERLRKRRQLRLVWFIGITVLLLLIVLAVVHHLDCRGVLWTMPVPLMGALGGFISSQRHVQSIASVGESLTDMTNLYFFGSNLTASAISGAVFAAVLFMLFAGGLVQGGLFPKWPVPENGDFWQEFAKLLTWSFIAGFAERFVPDTLDHLVARSSKQ